MVLTLCSILWVYYFLVRKRSKAIDSSSTFVFTEDIDCGSFISRLRRRLTQVTGGFSNYRGDRSVKRASSSGILTSPTGSICPNDIAAQQISNSDERTPMVMVDIEQCTDDRFIRLSMKTERNDKCQGDTTNPIARPLSIPVLAYIPESPPMYDASLIGTQTAQDRSSADSKILLGSGYLSTTSSRDLLPDLPPKQPGLQVRTSKLLLPRQTRNPPLRFSASRPASSVSIPSNVSVSSFSGHVLSKSSLLSPCPEPANYSSEIYISSPRQPSFDMPRSVSPPCSDASQNRPESLPANTPSYFPASRWLGRRPS